MPLNPQSMSPASQENTSYSPGETNSELGEPTEVRLSNRVTAKILKYNDSTKDATASTSQSTQRRPIATPNTDLFNELISQFFQGEDIIEIIAREPSVTVASTQTPQSQNQTVQLQDEIPTPIPDNVPLDPRLTFIVDSATGQVTYSFGTDTEKELVDGFIVGVGPVDKNNSPTEKGNASRLDIDTTNFVEFYGVPSIMNENAYINIMAAGGKGNNKFLIDRENQPRFYDATVYPSQSSSNVGSSKTPTTTNIINWSNDEKNRYKFPYKYQDFVFCKWWQKIPNNYMITLRRYPYPTNDSITSSDEVLTSIKKDNLYPVATMVTYLGEDTGNKISSLIGPIESGLNWKDVEADVWQVSTSTDPGSVNNPAPQLSKILGFLTEGAKGYKGKGSGSSSADPYSNGPYANKILGPVNVITTTKARARGLKFKHEMSLIFEYSLRSIGGVNTKAAALDIMSNILVMTSASASFWGGMNRFVPSGGGGQADPFLGGAAGRNAWQRGDPEGFINALRDQFTQIASNVSDFFQKIANGISSGNPLDTLKDVASGAASEFMKLTSTEAKTTVTGIHSLLTGAPVGEWHLQVGSPFNPIMMVGNLICTGVKIEFNDELGPDDFPTELKATITLEHGMPRDRDGIESMFNKGRGRIYALPKGYRDSLYSSTQSSNIDEAGGGRKKETTAVNPGNAGKGGQGSRRALLQGSVGQRPLRPDIIGPDVAYNRRYDYAYTSKRPTIRSVQAGLYSMGTVDPKGNYFPTSDTVKNDKTTSG